MITQLGIEICEMHQHKEQQDVKTSENSRQLYELFQSVRTLNVKKLYQISTFELLKRKLIKQTCLEHEKL